MIDERIQAINETEPEKQVVLTLEETPTIWLLDIQGSTVEKDSNYGAFILSKNEAYKQVNLLSQCT